MFIIEVGSGNLNELMELVALKKLHTAVERARAAWGMCMEMQTMTPVLRRRMAAEINAVLGNQADLGEILRRAEVIAAKTDPIHTNLETGIMTLVSIDGESCIETHEITADMLAEFRRLDKQKEAQGVARCEGCGLRHPPIGDGQTKH